MNLKIFRRLSHVSVMVGIFLLATTISSTTSPAEEATIPRESEFEREGTFFDDAHMVKEHVSGDDQIFEGKLREYLLENPEIIIDAIKLYQTQQRTQESQHLQKTILANQSSLENDPLSPVAGNPNAEVTVVEFFDYRCGYCKKILGTMMDYVSTDSNVRVVFKEFPILGPDSELASRAALASRMQNKETYLPFHNTLMISSGSLSENRLLAIGKNLGLDPDQLRSDMQSEDVSKAIQRNRDLARKLGITGTPSMVVGDRLIQGFIPREQFDHLISVARGSS